MYKFCSNKRCYEFLQVLDESKVQAAEDMYEHFKTAESASKLYVNYLFKFILLLGLTCINCVSYFYCTSPCFLTLKSI